MNQLIRFAAPRLVPVLWALGILVPTLSFSAPDPLRQSVVKIFTTTQQPNYFEPWRTGAQENVSGSGCVLPGNRILTNAHVVSNEIFIQVLKDGDTKKYTAKKLFAAHDCDLAVLQVEDSKFFEGTLPVTFGALPVLKDKVSVYGYPVGGEELSITEGVVSRIEIIPYSHSSSNILGIQTDAAINAGNSGGPVFANRRLVGVAFQAYNSIMAQNTGYIVPIQLVKRFLEQIQSGPYLPVPSLGIFTETMENDSLRAFYGMKPEQTGVLITKVIYGSSAWDRLQEKDVLCSIDGSVIANDGSIPFRPGERIGFQYPLCLRQPWDVVMLGILREGKPLQVALELKPAARLVPVIEYDQPPTYFLLGGLVFAPLNMNYIRAAKLYSNSVMSLYLEGLPSEKQKQVVLMSHVLSHEINKGYGSEYANLAVRKVNGKPIVEIQDLIAAFESPVDGRHVIEIDGESKVGKWMVLDAEKVKQATQEIMSQNNILSDRSEDLKLLASKPVEPTPAETRTAEPTPVESTPAETRTVEPTPVNPKPTATKGVTP